MTHAWLNLLAVLFSGFMGTQTLEPASENQPEYAVIERISDSDAILETARGNFSVPLELLPPSDRAEGAVLEIRIANDERDRRLASGQARLLRMKNAQNTVEL